MAEAIPVLDSHALLAYFEDEPAAVEVGRHFEAAVTSGRELPLCVVNWGEVVYIVLRERGEAAMERVIAAMDELPIALVDADRELPLRAARFKASHRLSYADSFCCALAEALDSPVLTGDPEFRAAADRVELRFLE
jgi:ribonuclease VapC